MPQPRETLVYVHRLKASEKEAVLAHASVFPASTLGSDILEAIEEVCVDRLIRASGCLELANQLAAPGANEESMRAAVGRAYYSIHHCLRAMALWQNKWDPDGHEESIKKFRTLLEDNGFRLRSGLVPGDAERVVEARTNRHIADYSPYDVQRDPPSVSLLRITSGTWPGAVRFNISLAGEMFQGAMKFVGS